MTLRTIVLRPSLMIAIAVSALGCSLQTDPQEPESAVSETSDALSKDPACKGKSQLDTGDALSCHPFYMYHYGPGTQKADIKAAFATASQPTVARVFQESVERCPENQYALCFFPDGPFDFVTAPPRDVKPTLLDPDLRPRYSLPFNANVTYEEDANGAALVFHANDLTITCPLEPGELQRTTLDCKTKTPVGEGYFDDGTHIISSTDYYAARVEWRGRIYKDGSFHFVTKPWLSGGYMNGFPTSVNAYQRAAFVGTIGKQLPAPASP